MVGFWAAFFGGLIGTALGCLIFARLLRRR